MVHPAKGNTVDLEGTGHEEDTLGQVLQENNTLATETTGQKDQDSTRLEGFPELRGLDALANLFICREMLESIFFYSNCAK